jgi:hypothetical protein
MRVFRSLLVSSLSGLFLLVFWTLCRAQVMCDIETWQKSVCRGWWRHVTTNERGRQGTWPRTFSRLSLALTIIACSGLFSFCSRLFSAARALAVCTLVCCEWRRCGLFSLSVSSLLWVLKIIFLVVLRIYSCSLIGRNWGLVLLAGLKKIFVTSCEKMKTVLGLS